MVKLKHWPHRLTVRTQGSHPCNRGSIPREVTSTNMRTDCFMQMKQSFYIPAVVRFCRDFFVAPIEVNYLRFKKIWRGSYRYICKAENGILKSKKMKNDIDFIDGKCYYKGKEIKIK